MDNWDEKISHKLKTYEFSEEPDEQKVQDFFAAMDQQDKPNSAVWLKIAASILVIIGLSVITFQFFAVQVQTAANETHLITLPDNSTVAINEQTKVSYNRISWFFDRTVNMEGEGFFEVEKGSTFRVISNLGVTEVLGTSFNVFASGGKYNVKCYSGKVHVKVKNQKALLTPGKAIAANNGEVEKYNFTLTNEAGWQSNEVQFDNQPLQYVLLELEQSYDVKVVLDDSLNNLRYSGYFPKDNLDLALKLICDPLTLDYAIDETRILISAKDR